MVYKQLFVIHTVTIAVCITFFVIAIKCLARLNTAIITVCITFFVIVIKCWGLAHGYYTIVKIRND